MEQINGGKLRYEVFGPFPFRTNATTPHRQVLKEFWADRDKDPSLQGLSGAIGVYVWTIKQNRRWVPWNVGLTDKQGFGGRFVQKETTFLRLLNEQPGAEIEVYLLALRSKTGRFRRPTASGIVKANHWLETMLIGSAISINPGLRNKANAKYLKNAVVDGYLNDEEEKRSKAARSFNALFKARPTERN